MMKKTFSIITATLNVVNKISKTLDSIVSQNQDLFEYIIIDGGSTDGTLDVINSYIHRFNDNLKVISERDNGIYDAFNKGISMSTGEYLYFIGAGDMLLEGVLEQVVKHLNYSLELIYGNVYWGNFYTIYRGMFDKTRICYAFMPHQAIFYKKEIFHKVGMYSLKYPIFADAVLNTKCFADDFIEKRYINMVIAYYEGNGYSVYGRDINFATDIAYIIDKYLGQEYLVHYKYSGRAFFDFLRHHQQGNIIIDGVNRFALDIYEIIQEYNTRFNNDIKVIGFIDDSTETSDRLLEIPILTSSQIRSLDFDMIVITDIGEEKRNRYNKLKSMGISEKNISMGQYCICGSSFLEILDNNMTANFIIFGTGKAGQDAYKTIEYYKTKKNKKYNVKCFFDNNPEKWDKTIYNLPIKKPYINEINKYDIILIASMSSMSIENQLIDMGISPLQIIVVQ